MKLKLLVVGLIFQGLLCFGQKSEGTITDVDRAQSSSQRSAKKMKKSSATIRWENYLINCTNYNSANIPSTPVWNMDFNGRDLGGDLANNPNIIRRDPSKVLFIGGKYYVWYTRSVYGPSNWHNDPNANPADRVFPWDYSDVYYATSTDGLSWQEKGSAVLRGPSGAFDDRSVFTPEVFEHEGTYYLVYQVVKSPYIERVKNNVAMAKATSPDGPWTKLPAPILSPANNGVWTAGSTSRFDADVKGDFDSHKVHDPCLVFFKDKFYLYYKGERMGEERYCGEREIRWGVAIADNPEGPYTKSEYNPITNTGHEMIVWPYNDGIAIIQKLDGPEINSIQFAPDGVNFEMMGRFRSLAANYSLEAFGLYNPDVHENSPSGGVKWGLAHKLNGGDRMFLRRFDIVNDTRVRTVVLKDESISLDVDATTSLAYDVFPISSSNKSVSFTSSNPTIATVNGQGMVTAVKAGETIITITSQDGQRKDTATIIVTAMPLSIDDFQHNNAITLYADANKEYLIIDGFDKGRVELFSYSGALLTKTESLNDNKIGISALASGLYIVRLTDVNNTIKVLKFKNLK